MKNLHPEYIVGFIDGEGSFNVSLSRHKTLRRGVEVRAAFEIELRADDWEILERIRNSLGCGSIYELNYKRYGWYPHVKYKISSVEDLSRFLIPFLDKHRLKAKKKKVYKLFRRAVFLMKKKKHLDDDGFREILEIRDQIRALNKKHYRNR
jgi:hypothetical protein